MLKKTLVTGVLLAVVAACGGDDDHGSDAPPHITAVTPDFGPVGSTVQIRGTDFGYRGDYRAIRFGNLIANATYLNQNLLEVEVPEGATRGDLSLVVKAQASNTQVFTVTRFDSSRWESLVAGSHHTCGFKSDGDVFCWGRNITGQLGIGSNRLVERFPISPAPAGGWVSIAPGAYLNDGNTCGVRKDGVLWCWGDNQLAQFGNNTFDGGTEPVKIGSSTLWKSAYVGGTSTCAVTKAGVLYCWGAGSGTNSHSYSKVPEVVASELSWRQLSMGYGSRCGIKSDNSLWCWGDNASAQLGLGGFGDELFPTRVGSGVNWAAVSVGGTKGAGHACALNQLGELWCWGDNDRGQLGDGSFSVKSRPVRIGGASWKSVAAGTAHTCAIKDDGGLWCWGSNLSLQLGQPDAAEFNVPVRVGAAKDWKQVSLGTNHSCGVKKNGTAWCWGDNLEGQLGVSGLDSSHEPVQLEWSAVR